MAHSMPTDAPTSHPVALAFAVAALQSGEPSGMIDGSLLQVASAQGAPKKTSEQLPGSGSDSNEVAFSQIKKSAEEDDDSAKRLARSRERNREHARRTRLRKKAQLEALQSKVKGLEAERQVLKQQIEECSIASILLGLSTGDQDETTQNLLDSNATKTDAKATKVALLAGGKRKRFVSNAIGAKSSTQQTLKVKIDGKTLLIGGGSKSHVNWKTGVFFDEDGSQKQLTPDQLEDLRRERNRMHAKMTRDRKKCFISTIEKTIDELESDIKQMKDILADVSASKCVTPVTSPTFKPLAPPELTEEENTYSPVKGESSVKRTRHSFSLIN